MKKTKNPVEQGEKLFQKQIDEFVAGSVAMIIKDKERALQVLKECEESLASINHGKYEVVIPEGEGYAWQLKLTPLTDEEKANILSEVYEEELDRIYEGAETPTSLPEKENNCTSRKGCGRC